MVLGKLTHMILDEIHTRDLNTDLVSLLLREILPRWPRLKLIVMSATLQAQLFSRLVYVILSVYFLTGLVYTYIYNQSSRQDFGIWGDVHPCPKDLRGI